MKNAELHVAALGRAKVVAIVLALTIALSGCGGGTPKPSTVTITSPTASQQLDVGKSVVIQGVAKGENIVRVDVLVNGKLYASASSGDNAKGVPEMPVDGIAWTPMSAGNYAIEFRVFGPNEQLISRSDPVVVTAKGQAALQPTVAPPTAPAGLVPTVAPNPIGGTSAPPGPTAAPTSSAPSLTISNDFANIREGPNTAYRLLGQLQQNQTVPVRGRNPDSTWWQIAYAQGTGGVGWVFGELVQANDAAKAVPVAAAPPLPTPPPAPPPVVPTNPPAPVAPPPVVSGPKTQGNLTVDRTVVPPNGTVNVSWNVQGISKAEFDAGDGGGFKPAGGTMSFPVSGISSNRSLQLRITYSDGRQAVDAITVTIDPNAVVSNPVAPPVSNDCSPSSPDWKEKDNPDYKFCVRRDMDFIGESANNQQYSAGTDRTFRMGWDVYGINGIRWRLFPFSSGALGCGPGSTTIDLPVAGTTDNHTFNIKDLGRGLYKIQLAIQRRDGGSANYNEKIFCIR